MKIVKVREEKVFRIETWQNHCLYCIWWGLKWTTPTSHHKPATLCSRIKLHVKLTQVNRSKVMKSWNEQRTYFMQCTEITKNPIAQCGESLRTTMADPQINITACVVNLKVMLNSIAYNLKTENNILVWKTKCWMSLDKFVHSYLRTEKGSDSNQCL